MLWCWTLYFLKYEGMFGVKLQDISVLSFTAVKMLSFVITLPVVITSFSIVILMETIEIEHGIF
jgi:uncharacterized protein (DUF486 family)